MISRTVLEVRQLRKQFGGQIVLDGIDAALQEGDVVLLRGENGSGKTTLLNILTGNLEPDAGAIHLIADGTEERFLFPRRWWADVNPLDHFTPERLAEEAVGRTWQDVRLFATRTLLDNIMVAFPHQAGERPLRLVSSFGGISREEAGNRRKALSVLGSLGLEGREQSTSDRISLGQSKRVAIARAVAAGARILFLDEPLSGLDVGGIRGVLDMLVTLVREHRVTLVIVEHLFNIQLILDIASSVWTLRTGGLTVERPDDVRTQLAAGPGDETLRRLSERLGAPGPQVEVTWPSGARFSVFRRPAAVESGAGVALNVDGLVVHRGRRRVIGWPVPDSGRVEGLTFTLFDGDVAVLQAPNGWGKSTLMEALQGTLPVEGGQILLDGRPLARVAAWERARAGLASMPARGHGFPCLTVAENLKLARGTDASHASGRDRRPAGVLSGGQRQSLALSCLPRSPRCLLMDEPFASLDDSGISRVLEVVAGVASRGCVLISLPAASTVAR